MCAYTDNRVDFAINADNQIISSPNFLPGGKRDFSILKAYASNQFIVADIKHVLKEKTYCQHFSSSNNV